MMKVNPMKRIWDDSWPAYWPRILEVGREPLIWHLHHHAVHFPQKPAIIFYGKFISYKELDQMVYRFAGGLRSLGLTKGDRIYLCLENSPQYIISYYAAGALGLVVVPGNPMNKEEELVYMLNNSGAKAVIIEDILFPLLQTIRNKVSLDQIIVTSLSEYLPDEPTLPVPSDLRIKTDRYQDVVYWNELINNEPISSMEILDIKRDLALIQYTSGTTGNPKGAMLTHYNALYSAISTANIVPTSSSNDIYLTVLPLCHVSATNSSMNAPIYLGATIVLICRFDMETLLMAIEKYQCTVWNAISTMNIAVMNYPKVNDYDLSSLQSLASGGAPVPLPVLEQYKNKTGCDLVEAFGMSETIGAAICNPPRKNVIGSIGIPLMGNEIRIADLSNELIDAAIGEEGELWIQSPSNAIGYWNDDAETAKTFLEDGWLKTGDIVKMDDQGYIYICGRIKEMIKASGYSVYPVEVEKYLYNHPAIAECCVIGIPHEYRGEDIKAFVVLKPDWVGKITEQEIVDWARDQMAVYKYPRIIEFRDALPKGGTGKIMRKILKQEETNAAIFKE